jgi:hypothetical protein
MAPRDGGLAAIDKQTGRILWFLASSAPSEDALAFGFAAAPVVAGDTLIAADLAGRVYAFAQLASNASD